MTPSTSAPRNGHAPLTTPTEITFTVNLGACAIEADFHVIALDSARLGERVTKAAATIFPNAKVQMGIGQRDGGTDWLKQLPYAEVQHHIRVTPTAQKSRSSSAASDVVQVPPPQFAEQLA